MTINTLSSILQPIFLRLNRVWTAVATTAVISIATSCSSPMTTMTYFDNVPVDMDVESLTALDYELRIVPDDELDINVTSPVPAAALPFSNASYYSTVIDSRSGMVQTQPTQTSALYLVDKAGDITFPVLGKIHVAGLTPTGLASMLAERIGKEIEDPTVTVRLTNFHVNVLGEVTKPGTVLATGERFSVLDALAEAQDMTAYAVRDDILVVREEGGQRVVHHINLNDTAALESPYFYLRQNDVIIVRPNEVKQSLSRYDTNKAYKVQVTSAIISACSVVASLVIALAIK